MHCCCGTREQCQASLEHCVQFGCRQAEALGRRNGDSKGQKKPRWLLEKLPACGDCFAKSKQHRRRRHLQRAGRAGAGGSRCHCRPSTPRGAAAAKNTAVSLIARQLFKVLLDDGRRGRVLVCECPTLALRTLGRWEAYRWLGRGGKRGAHGT